jgi:hypothetical protein
MKKTDETREAAFERGWHFACALRDAGCAAVLLTYAALVGSPLPWALPAVSLLCVLGALTHLWALWRLRGQRG